MIKNIVIKPNFIITSHGKPKPTPKPDLLEMHNIAREKSQVPPIAGNDRLKEAAEKHAKWMAEHGKVQHQNLKTFLGKPWRMVAENVAAYYINNEAVMRGWLESKGHKANILNPKFTHIGIGTAKHGKKIYWCCVFGSKKINNFHTYKQII